MFTPSYTISAKLLNNIKTIYRLVYELNDNYFPMTVMMELEREARVVSSHTSTRIEGNPLPLTEVRKVLKTSPQYLRDTEREVINYNNALEYLSQLELENVKFNRNLLMKIHKIVMDGLLQKYQIGKYRIEPIQVNWPITGEPVYLPPDHDDTKTLMADLFEFVDHSIGKLDPLLIAALFHKQFVIIHPFVDGNGRTCRLATKVLLAQMGVNTFNIFSFENYYNRNITNYFQKVGEFGDFYELRDSVDFSTWLEYFTDGIIDEMLRVKGELEKKDRLPEFTLRDSQKDLIEYVHENGFITDKIYSTMTDRAKATRAIDYNKLIERGYIKRMGKGKNTYYIKSQS